MIKGTSKNEQGGYIMIKVKSKNFNIGSFLWSKQRMLNKLDSKKAIYQYVEVERELNRLPWDNDLIPFNIYYNFHHKNDSLPKKYPWRKIRHTILSKFPYTLSIKAK